MNRSDVIPYDGMMHKSTTHHIYSNHSDNLLPSESPYQYNNTTAYNTKPIRKDVWGECRNRGGVLHNDKDHSLSNSKMDSDNITEKSMMDAYDTGNYGKVKNGAYKTLLGYDMDPHGNPRGSDINDYVVYGAYTANGTFLENGALKEDPSCNKKLVQAIPVKSTYSPMAPPAKQCSAESGYKYANGEVDTSVPGNGRGSECNSLYRDYEDHNMNYVHDHESQFHPSFNGVSHGELDRYKTNFMLLDGSVQGNHNYLSYGGNVNTNKMIPRTRLSNSHLDTEQKRM